MKVAFLSEVNKSQTRKLLTHLELSLSERSENSRFIRCSLSLLILPSSFHQDSNNALFAENKQAALLCEGPAKEKMSISFPLLQWKPTAPNHPGTPGTRGGTQAGQRNGPPHATLYTCVGRKVSPSKTPCRRSFSTLKPPCCPKPAAFCQFGGVAKQNEVPECAALAAPGWQEQSAQDAMNTQNNVPMWQESTNPGSS